MELDRGFDLDLDLPDEQGEPPIFELPPAPSRRDRPDPAADTRWLSAAMIAVVAGLGAIKLALFAMGTSAAMIGLGIVFVAVHGAVLAGGGAWFWGYRYETDG